MASPISPSISALGTRAATESMTTTDLERLLAGVGLGDEHFVDIDAHASGVAGIEGVLRVDEGDNAAEGLRLGEDLERQRGLARGLGSVDLDDAAAGDAADAERHIERERSGGNRLDLERGVVIAEAHDGACAVLALDLLACFGDGRRALVLIGDGLDSLHLRLCCFCHDCSYLSTDSMIYEQPFVVKGCSRSIAEGVCSRFTRAYQVSCRRLSAQNRMHPPPAEAVC